MRRALGAMTPWENYSEAVRVQFAKLDKEDTMIEQPLNEADSNSGSAVFDGSDVDEDGYNSETSSK